MNFVKLVCLLSTLLIGSCVQKVTTLKSDIDLQLDENTGYLLIGVETNLTLKSISISGEKNLKLSGDDIRKGSQYILVDVPAGDYSIDQIQLGGWFRTKLDNGLWDFTVSPGVISYVGHLNVETVSIWPLRTQIELENRSSAALQFLEQSFPNILSNRSLVYHGPGTDPFMKFVAEELE